MTEDEAAQRFTAWIAHMQRYAENGELIPHDVVEGDLSVLMDDGSLRDFIVGGLRATEEALRTTAHLKKASVTEVAETMKGGLDGLKATDVPTFGAQAYDDASELVFRTAQAMTERGAMGYDGFTDDRLAFACAALLWAQMLELAATFGIQPSEAGRRLALQLADTSG